MTAYAAGMGLFYDTPGEPFVFSNHRGETNIINGHGLYYFDTVSSAAQMQGNDLVTLVVGLPLLIISTWLAMRGSLRGRLMLTGTLGFILYTYMSMATLASYNSLFLVYVAIFTFSLYAFILSLMLFDLKTLPAHFSPKLPHGWITGLLFVVAGILTMAWLGRILQPLFQNQTPALENTTTLVIQFMDLSLIVPAAVLGGILLLAECLGLFAGIRNVNQGSDAWSGCQHHVNQYGRAGVPESLGIMVPFLVITAANLVMAVILLKNVKA